MIFHTILFCYDTDMPRRKSGKEQIRNLQKTKGSYHLSLPISLVHALGWQERQKVVVKKYGKKRILITDWPGKTKRR